MGSNPIPSAIRNLDAGSVCRALLNDHLGIESYDPDGIRRFYDQFGESEWKRLEIDARARVILHIHRWDLQQFIKAGDHVLEAGAGPGRFTIELAKLGAQVTVGDISPQQLELNRAKVEEAGLEAHVESRVSLDIVDCSQFRAESFDAVVCYGSPLCYVLGRADDALEEMLRVTKRGGYLLVSVCARLNMYLPWLIEFVRSEGIDVVEKYVATGEPDTADNSGHPMHCYTWSEFEALLQRHPVDLVAASASNFLARIEHIPLLEEIEQEPDFWEAFLRWEIESCKQPGVLDCGSHIIAVVRRA